MLDRTDKMRPSSLKEVVVQLATAISMIREFERRLAASIGTPLFEWEKRRYPKRGTIVWEEGEATYWFHGGGCSLTMNGSTLDYNYGYPNIEPGKRPICFGPWKLARTIQGVREKRVVDQVSRVTEERAMKDLLAMAEIGLSKKPPPGRGYFEVNEALLYRYLANA